MYVAFTDDHTRYTSLQAFRTKDEAFQVCRHIPLVLKFSTPRTSNDSVLITAVSLQLIGFLLILSSKPRNVTLPRPIRLSKWCGRITQPPPYGTHARDPTSPQFAQTFMGRRYLFRRLTRKWYVY